MIRFNKNDLNEFKRNYFGSYTWTAVISWLLGVGEYYYSKENPHHRKIVVIRWLHPITILVTIQVFTWHIVTAIFKFFIEVLNNFKQVEKKPDLSTHKRLSRISFLMDLIEFLKRNEVNEK